MRALGCASAALAAALLATVPGSASVPYVDNCAPRGEIVSALSEKFRENPAAVGQVNQNAVVEVFVSDSGTWTIIATGTDGKSCIVSSGEGWESTPAMLIGQNA